MKKSLPLTKELTLKGKPFLIFITFWLSVKFKEGSLLKITINNRQPTIIEKYLPSSKFYGIEIIKENQIPLVHVQYNDHSVTINLNEYQPDPSLENMMEFYHGKLHFLYENFRKTDEIYKKYETEKPDEIQRFRMNESIMDIIRSETEFVMMVDKDQDIEMMKKIDKIEKDMEHQLSEELITVSNTRFSLKNLVLIFLVFMVVGYFIGQPEKLPEKLLKKTKNKKKKAKSKPKRK